MDLNYGWRKSTVQKQIFTTRHLVIKKRTFGDPGSVLTLLLDAIQCINVQKCGIFI